MWAILSVQSQSTTVSQVWQPAHPCPWQLQQQQQQQLISMMTTTTTTTAAITTTTSLQKNRWLGQKLAQTTHLALFGPRWGHSIELHNVNNASQVQTCMAISVPTCVDSKFWILNPSASFSFLLSNFLSLPLRLKLYHHLNQSWWAHVSYIPYKEESSFSPMLRTAASGNKGQGEKREKIQICLTYLYEILILW